MQNTYTTKKMVKPYEDKRLTKGFLFLAINSSKEHPLLTKEVSQVVSRCTWEHKRYGYGKRLVNEQIIKKIKNCEHNRNKYFLDWDDFFQFLNKIIEEDIEKKIIEFSDYHYILKEELKKKNYQISEKGGSYSILCKPFFNEILKSIRGYKQVVSSLEKSRIPKKQEKNAELLEPYKRKVLFLKRIFRQFKDLEIEINFFVKELIHFKKKNNLFFKNMPEYNKYWLKQLFLDYFSIIYYSKKQPSSIKEESYNVLFTLSLLNKSLDPRIETMNSFFREFFYLNKCDLATINIKRPLEMQYANACLKKITEEQEKELREEWEKGAFEND